MERRIQKLWPRLHHRLSFQIKTYIHPSQFSPNDINASDQF